MQMKITILKLKETNVWSVFHLLIFQKKYLPIIYQEKTSQQNGAKQKREINKTLLFGRKTKLYAGGGGTS